MSKYTTGEIAKLCGVTVRTVQYYDSRGILVPSDLSEGGRRLYSEEDLKKMRIICFLRDLDFSIPAISQLFAEERPENVIDVLLQQQLEELQHEISSQQEKLRKLQQLQQILKSEKNFSVESLSDIATMMDNKKKLSRMHWKMIGVGMISEAVEVGTAVLWACTGIWWPFAFIAVPVMIALGIWLSRYYFKKVAYICPECHTVFKPKFKEMFWANHTPKTRKLRCPECGRKSYCVEVYAGGDE